MANNVYIGMRYVPIFDGAWDATKSYEALVIVEYGNNTYTSKKPVPVGTLPTDTTYWALTGNYNGQISALDSRITANENRIGTGNLPASATNLTDAINYSDLAHVKSQKMIFIGDSYAATTDFFGRMNTFLGHTTMTSFTTNSRRSRDGYIIGARKGGAGFVNDGTAYPGYGNGFLQLLQEVAGALTSSEKDEIKQIYVCGGVNDSYFTPSEQYIDTGMANFKTYVDNNFKNATVSVAFLGRVRVSNASNILPEDVKICLYKYIDCCGANAFRFITNSEYIMHQNDALLASDNIHPVGGADYVLGTHLLKGLITGSCDVHWVPSIGYLGTPVSPASGTGSAIKYEISNNVVKVRFTNGMVLSLGGQSMAYGTKVKVMTQNAFYTTRPISFVMPVSVQAGTWRMCMMEITFDGYDVYFAQRGSESAGLATISPTGFSMAENIEFRFDPLDL